MDSRTRTHPVHTLAVELSWFGASKLPGPGQFVPKGALPFSVHPETGFWITHCASGQKTGTHAHGVAGRGLSLREHLSPVLAKAVQFVQSGLMDGSVLAGSTHSSAPPTGSLSTCIQ